MIISSVPSKPITKPKIAYTLGDPGGIGPELFTKFYDKYKNNNHYEIILVDQNLNPNIQKSKPSKEAGEHAYQTLVKANQMLLNKEADFLVTGPVCKESLWLAGIELSGQTEVLASLNKLNRNQIEMFFILETFRIVLATRHEALKDVSQLYLQRIETVIQHSKDALKKIFKIPNAKIAILGLNPHAGENGIIGNEEKDFVSKLIAPNKDLFGPFSPDACLANAAQKYLTKLEPDFDLYIAAYHDQALPLIKGIGGLKAINMTYGLPYLRVSVDHGTAYDLVGTGKASIESLEACTEFCLKLS
jgi:4-hydroxy-L-threonine phosphate dehydrogenase PdxA